MDRTITLNPQDFQVLDQLFQTALRVVDIKSAKVVLDLHSKIEGQLVAQNTPAPAPEPSTPAA